jgi:hypothetical protein
LGIAIIGHLFNPRTHTKRDPHSQRRRGNDEI